jgi:hypothetical protein
MQTIMKNIAIWVAIVLVTILDAAILWAFMTHIPSAPAAASAMMSSASENSAVSGLLASNIASLSGATTTVFFAPYGDETLDLGSTTSIDIDVSTSVPINAVGATISFPKDTLEIVSICKGNSFFNLWTEDTSISEDTGQIHFSGGTTRRGGVVGTSTMLTLMVRAKTPGTAQLAFTDIQVYPSDGTGRPISTQTRSISYTITALPPNTATTTTNAI